MQKAIIIYIALLALRTIELQAQVIEKIWERFYRSAPDSSTIDDYCRGFVPLSDGGYLVSAAYQNRYGWYSWIFRADFDGEIVWEDRYPPESPRNRGYLLRYNEDECLLMSSCLVDGRTQAHLTCISNEGDVPWERTYPCEVGDVPLGVLVLQDGTIFLETYRASRDSSERYVITLIDQSGFEFDSRAYGHYFSLGGCQIEPDRIVLASTVQVDRYHNAPAVFVVNSHGDSLDYRTFPAQLYLHNFGVSQLYDGNLLIYGVYGEILYSYFIKLNRNCQMIWSAYYDNVRYSYFNDLANLSDDRIVFAGNNIGSRAWIGEINPWGEFACDQSDSGLGWGYFCKIRVIDDDNVIVSGITLPRPDMHQDDSYNRNIWVARYSIPRLSVRNTIPYLTENYIFRPFPNPFNSNIYIPIEIFSDCNPSLQISDESGRNILFLPSEVLQTGKYTYYWEFSELPSGAYFFHYFNGRSIIAYKILKTK
ncbi:MAG: T9SS type A sorting domain-containing protein [Calditrichaeota bacterium]|nr:T9SS type A sorting domain-containing protein [Calditrichota bacterium]